MEQIKLNTSPAQAGFILPKVRLFRHVYGGPAVGAHTECAQSERVWRGGIYYQIL